MEKQTKTSIFYSINVTLAPVHLLSYVDKLAYTLQQVNQTITFLEEIKISIFLDVFMMMRIQEKHPLEYAKIQQELHLSYKRGADLGIYINMEWQNTEDLHQLSSDAVLDVFVHGKDEILKIMHLKSTKPVKRIMSLKEKLNNTEVPELSVRISNGKLNPFVHLLDSYQFIKAKLDTSVFARLVAAPFYDYKKIAPGSVFRFSNNPIQAQRFGQFLALPRCSFVANSLWCLRSDKILKRQIKKQGSTPRFFIREEEDMNYSPIRVTKQRQTFIVSPDAIPKRRFVETINRAKITHAGIISIESFLMNLSRISFNNLEVLIESKMSFVNTSHIIDTFGVSTNKVFFK